MSDSAGDSSANEDAVESSNSPSVATSQRMQSLSTEEPRGEEKAKRAMREKNAAKVRRWRKKQKEKFEKEAQDTEAAKQENVKLKEEEGFLKNRLSQLNESITQLEQTRAQRTMHQQAQHLNLLNPSVAYSGANHLNPSVAYSSSNPSMFMPVSSQMPNMTIPTLQMGHSVPPVNFTGHAHHFGTAIPDVKQTAQPNASSDTGNPATDTNTQSEQTQQSEESSSDAAKKLKMTPLS